PVVEPVRSPRQCMGPAPAMPRRVRVVMGPFIGWNTQLGHAMPTPGPPVLTPRLGVTRNGLSFGKTAPNGSLSPHARLSTSPKMWQLAHAEGPWAEVVRASYRNGRPSRTAGGSGSKRSGSTAVSVAAAGLLALLTIEMSCEKRFIT